MQDVIQSEVSLPGTQGKQCLLELGSGKAVLGLWKLACLFSLNTTLCVMLSG